MPSETLRWMLRMSNTVGALQHIRNTPLAVLPGTTYGAIDSQSTDGRPLSSGPRQEELVMTRHPVSRRWCIAISGSLLLLGAAATTALAVALPAGATPPGTNGKLVFERPTRNGANLFTVAADGSGLTRLTGLPGLEGDSSWSPDGSKVAFVRARNPEQGPYEIWAVNADGSGLVRLTRHRGFSIAPAWSPDGRKIVYATDAGRRERLGLYLMNSDGTRKQRLTTSRAEDYSDPSWSPDGDSIAFAILRPPRPSGASTRASPWSTRTTGATSAV
jgi:Tol biopolymer transport system component